MYQATGIWVNKRIEKLPNVILENGPSALETLLNELSEAESHEISASSDVKSTNMVVKTLLLVKVHWYFPYRI